MTDQKVQLNSIIDELFFQLAKYKNENEELVKINKELTDKYNTDIKSKNNEISNFSKVSSIISANKELNECKQYIKLLESQLEKFKKVNKEESVEIKKEDVETKEPEIKKEVVETKEPEIKKKVIAKKETETKKEQIVETKKEQIVETKKEQIVEIKKEQIVEIKKEPKTKKEVIETKKEPETKKEETVETEDNIFDIDNFEDINGYELLQYKKKYYLRDLETNEIYNIINYKPDSVIGLMSNNRIKLHTK
jgi:hypothetical protein